MSPPVALVVDDMPDVLAILSDAVEMALPDHQVVRASSARVALRAFDELASSGQKLALLLVDQRLGDATGLSLVGVAQSRAAELGSPAYLLVTGLEDEDVRSEALGLGVEVIHKPFRLSALVAAIHRVMESAPPSPDLG